MKDIKPLHIYCTDELRAKLKAIADADDRSMSYKVQELIIKAYDDFVRKSKNNLKR